MVKKFEELLDALERLSGRRWVVAPLEDDTNLESMTFISKDNFRASLNPKILIKNFEQNKPLKLEDLILLEMLHEKGFDALEISQSARICETNEKISEEEIRARQKGELSQEEIRALRPSGDDFKGLTRYTYSRDLSLTEVLDNGKLVGEHLKNFSWQYKLVKKEADANAEATTDASSEELSKTEDRGYASSKILATMSELEEPKENFDTSKLNEYSLIISAFGEPDEYLETVLESGFHKNAVIPFAENGYGYKRLQQIRDSASIIMREREKNGENALEFSIAENPNNYGIYEE